MIFQIDKTIYEKLSETERYIVDFIIQNENKISYLSITNIADNTFSSPATVSRTIQKGGFKGIAELRYLISKEDKDKSKNVSPYAINKLLDKVYQESTQTIENIPIPAILKAIDHINNAEKIFIYARGFTAMFAEHFQMYLQLMGYHAIVVKDVKWMEQTKNLVTSADTVFVLSVCCVLFLQQQLVFEKDEPLHGLFHFRSFHSSVNAEYYLYKLWSGLCPGAAGYLAG